MKFTARTKKTDYKSRDLFTPIYCAALAVCPSVWASEAGKVLFSQGDVSAISVSGDRMALTRGSLIEVGTTLVVGAGKLQVRFIDGALMSFKPNTRFQIKEYVFDAKDPTNAQADAKLIEGGLRTLTGAIGKVNREGYKLETPTGTIGIRGTEFTIDGSRITVTEGEIFKTYPGEISAKQENIRSGFSIDENARNSGKNSSVDQGLENNKPAFAPQQFASQLTNPSVQLAQAILPLSQAGTNALPPAIPKTSISLPLELTKPKDITPPPPVVVTPDPTPVVPAPPVVVTPDPTPLAPLPPVVVSPNPKPPAPLPPVVVTPDPTPVAPLPPVVVTPDPTPPAPLPPVVVTPNPTPVAPLPPVVVTPDPTPVAPLPPVVVTPDPTPVVPAPPVVVTPDPTPPDPPPPVVVTTDPAPTDPPPLEVLTPDALPVNPIPNMALTAEAATLVVVPTLYVATSRSNLLVSSNEILTHAGDSTLSTSTNALTSVAGTFETLSSPTSTTLTGQGVQISGKTPDTPITVQWGEWVDGASLTTGTALAGFNDSSSVYWISGAPLTNLPMQGTLNYSAIGYSGSIQFYDGSPAVKIGEGRLRSDFSVNLADGVTSVTLGLLNQKTSQEVVFSNVSTTYDRNKNVFAIDAASADMGTGAYALKAKGQLYGANASHAGLGFLITNKAGEGIPNDISRAAGVIGFQKVGP